MKPLLPDYVVKYNVVVRVDVMKHTPSASAEDGRRPQLIDDTLDKMIPHESLTTHCVWYHYAYGYPCVCVQMYDTLDVRPSLVDG